MVSRDQALRRSKRIIKPPTRYSEGNAVSLVSYFFAGPLVERVPSSCKDTTRVKEVDYAKDEEVISLRGNEAWDLVPKVVGVTPVTYKWRLKLKKKEEGSITPFRRC
ncbi:hypothetical protein KSP40_PGU010430 [Platanthera guangdongensis]|uniref:Transposase n=1 Tax=Platanthera guangdongensis TaxID=2320717 RepID=A0ABR2MTX6_9ASPA